MHPLRPSDPERIGDYTILGLLGEGPRGETFLGRESDDTPIRAIKLLPGVPEPDPDALAPYLAAQRVSSSYVARVLAAGYLADRPYIVREHVEGRSLAEVVAADGPLTGDALERVAIGVLTALSAVHLAGLTHRSLTPHNVILAAEGPRVTDVTVGDPVGEVAYQAPEQLTGLQYGPYADVFAWAATLTFAGTGKPPFADREAVLDGEPEVGVEDEAMRRVLLSALAKDVGQRPTTYSALMQVLGDPGTGRPPEQTAIEGVPVPGVALQGVPIPAVPLPGVQPPGIPPQGPMVPAQGGPMQGSPMHGPLTQGPPMQGPPMQGPPMQGPQMQGPPMQGVPVPQAEPMWGPQEPAPQQPPQQIRLEAVQPRGSQGPRRRFPMGLVAGVGAVALVSAIGLWGATRYVEYQEVGTTVAAPQNNVDGIPVPNSASAAPGPQGTAPDGTVPQPPQPTVTVPWGATQGPDEAGVAPLVLPTEWPTSSAGVPELTSVPTTPSGIPTQPVVVPTVTAQPTVAATTAQPTPTKKKQKPKPTATVTKTEQPTPTPTPTEKPSEKPSEEPTPTEKPTEKPTTAAPEPKPTPTKPKPTPTQPKPTPTQPKPTPTQPKPTPKQAAPVKNPYTPTQVCGSGFSVQRSSSFSGGVTYQLWNNGTGQNCVVTMKTANVGKASPVSATLEVQNGGSKTDSGNFEYYAGPVKLSAAGKCVRYSGSAGSGSTSVGWANCG